MSVRHFDILIIGGGIAGASVGANLAGDAKVALIEREARPGYHSTGRSAALFSEIYGNELIRALSRASRGFFFDPPPGFAAVPLVTPRRRHRARRAASPAARRSLGRGDDAGRDRRADRDQRRRRLGR